MAVLIAAMLLGLGLPSLMDTVWSTNSKNTVRLLATSLAYARSEAVSQNNIVTICASSNGTACNSATWDDGWLIFTDSDSDVLRDADEVILRVEDTSQSEITISISDNENNAETFNAFSFNGLGEVWQMCTLPAMVCADNVSVSFQASLNGQSASVQLTRVGAVGSISY